MKTIASFVFIFILFSCQEAEETKPALERGDLLSYAKLIDENYEILMPVSDKDVVYCSHYYPPCETAFRVRVLQLPVIVLQYKSYIEAKKAAKKIRGFLFHNWVFDEVTNEPFLLKRFEKVFIEGESFKNYGL